MDWRTEILGAFSRRNASVDADVVEEMAQHAAAAYQSARAGGAASDEALANVRTLIESWCADTRGPAHSVRAVRQQQASIDAAPASRSSWAGLSLDVRHAVRILRRHRGFALVSIVMIALGIGATAAMFSVIYGVLLKPLPFKTPDRLVRVVESREGAPPSRIPGAFTNGALLPWLATPSTTIEGIGAWESAAAELDFGSGPQRERGYAVNASLLQILGVAPQAGRIFSDADVDADRAIVLSYDLWRERFTGGDVVGAKILMDGKPREVIGVMPAGFGYPTTTTRYWVPFRIGPALQKDANGRLSIAVKIFGAIAKLKPGVSPAAAAAEGQARTRAGDGLGPAGPAVFGVDTPATITVTPLLEAMTKDVRPAMLVMLIAVVLLFVAAIGNVANMQLAHATTRRREVAIRSAIGAGTGRLARQLFVETSLTALVGSALGLVLASALLGALPKLLPSDFPRPEDIHLNGVVIGVVLVLAALTAIATGLLPARMARRANLSAVMLEDGAPVGHGLRSSSGRSRAILVTAQVAIAMLLLVGAALLGRSFAEMLRVDRGFTPSNLMTARVTLPRSTSAPEARRAMFDALIARIAGVGSVTHAAFTSALPLSGSVNLTGFDTPNPAGGKDLMINGSVQTVSRDYLAAMGMRVRDGRGFTAEDRAGSEPVLLVNDAFVRAYPGVGKVGATLRTGLGGEDDQRPWRVVGVTNDLHAGRAGDPATPELFVLSDQKDTDGTQYIVARTAGDPSALATTLRAIVRDLEPHAVIDQELTMEARVMQTLTRPRLYAALLGGFAVFALAIAGIGLFGGLSYGISQRTREIGVRAALGASPGQIVRLVVVQGLVITVVGLVIGAAAAYASSQYLTSFLFGVTAHDARSFAAVSVLLLAIAGVACIVPARRAAKIDPLIAMKR